MPMTARPAFLYLTPLMTVMLLALTACSGGDKSAKPASQVAVKVNGDELTVHQLNAALARLPSVPPDSADLVRKQVLDGLVDQRLLVQQAIDNKLDRNPDVVATIEQNRAQILAQAYVQKTLAAQARPNDGEIRKYFDDNPALFSQRRVYRLQELNTDLPAERVDELRAAMASAKSMPEIATWLQKNRFQVNANSAVRGAEQLPLSQLRKINAMKDGEIEVFVAERKVTVLQVLASQVQPVDEAKATPAIEQFLTGRKREELAVAELKRLRSTAKLEYVGDFQKLAQLPAQAVGVAASGVVPTSASTSPGASTIPPANPSTPASAAAPALAASSISKGIAGLR